MVRRETFVAVYDRLRGADCYPIATSLGLVADRRRRAIGPCPQCNAARRHTKSADKRGALLVRPDGKGWHCAQCETSGDAAVLVALHQDGARKLGDRGVEWAARWLGLDTSQPMPVTAPSRPVAAADDETEPDYPRERAAALWQACGRVDDDDEASAYLESRGIDAAEVSRLDLARVLPVEHRPRWAWHCPVEGGPAATWAESGFRLIVPLWTATGELGNVTARPLYRPTGPRKSSCCGTRTGLVMADTRAWIALAQDGPASSRGAPIALVMEGEPDYLEVASWRWPDGARPMVFGMFNGGWKQPVADRIPDGTHVVVCTHDDAAGDGYAADIAGMFLARIEAGRVTYRRDSIERMRGSV